LYGANVQIKSHTIKYKRDYRRKITLYKYKINGWLFIRATN